MAKIKLTRELVYWLRELIDKTVDAVDFKIDTVEMASLIADTVDNDLQDGDEQYVDLTRCRDIDTHRAAQNEDSVFEELPERVEFWRKKRGLSVEDMCELAHMSKDEYKAFVSLDLRNDSFAVVMAPLLFVEYDQIEGLRDIQGASGPDVYGSTVTDLDLKDDVYLQALIIAQEGKEGLAKRLNEAK